MLTVFLKLFLAHMIGDFVLQPKSWVIKRSHHIGYLLLHIMVHAGLLVLFFVQNLEQYWQLIVFVSATHLVIDSLKIWWEKKWPYRPVMAFTIDQFLHVSVLIAAVLYIYQVQISLPDIFTDEFLIYLTTVVVIVFASPVFMRVFFSKWDRENAFNTKQKDTLLDAGLIIGILERVIIVVFIQVDFLEGIGFLMAAKSIFRFGDLTNSKSTKFTEYILVGTFLSFTIALAIGFGLKWVMASL